MVGPTSIGSLVMSMSASCLNWWYMLGSFCLMCSAAFGDLLLDPGDVEEHAAVRAAAAGFHLAHDAARDVIARQQLRRDGVAFLSPCVVAPAFFGVVGRLVAVVLGDVVEHEALALACCAGRRLRRARLR